MLSFWSISSLNLIISVNFLCNGSVMFIKKKFSIDTLPVFKCFKLIILTLVILSWTVDNFLLPWSLVFLFFQNVAINVLIQGMPCHELNFSHFDCADLEKSCIYFSMRKSIIWKPTFCFAPSFISRGVCFLPSRGSFYLLMNGLKCIT